MRKEKRKWKCPKCGITNCYEVKIGGFGLPIPIVIGNPKCKKCNLGRFSPDYYKSWS